MTREEVIRFLGQLQRILIDSNSWKSVKQVIRESFTMAIEALEADVPDTNFGDTISRQAAMEICRRMVWNGTDDYLPMSANAIENEIRQLPPVKVCETAPNDLISRQDAIYAISKDIMGGLNYERILKELPSAEPRHNFPEKAQLSGKDTTSDCISRQAAIDAAIEATDDWDGGYNITRANMIEKKLNDLPSAQPESDDWSEYSGKLWKAAYERGKKDAEQPEWIPTSKKLPKINQPVLVWTSGDYWLAELHLLDDVFYWDFDTFDLSGEEFNDVVAWMPLPEPYKEAKDEYSN